MLELNIHTFRKSQSPTVTLQHFKTVKMTALVVLVLVSLSAYCVAVQPITCLFWFPVIAPIDTAGSCFQQEGSKTLLPATS